MTPISTVVMSTSVEMKNWTTTRMASTRPQTRALPRWRTNSSWSTRKISGGTARNERFKWPELVWAIMYGENPKSRPPAKAAGRQVVHRRAKTYPEVAVRAMADVIRVLYEAIGPQMTVTGEKTAPRASWLDCWRMLIPKGKLA